MTTPLRAQYLRVKRPFPDALLFFRLGDAYELYEEDARTAARELAVPLAVREFSRDERVPLCAVPYHTVDGHISRLISRGYKVAICEQIGDPRTGKDLVEREVVCVVSPSAAPGDQRRPTPTYSRDTMVAEQPSGTVAPSLTDTRQGPPPDSDDTQRSASDTGARISVAVQLSLFGTSAGPAITE